MRKWLSILAIFVLSMLSISAVSATFVPGELGLVSAKVNGDEVDLYTREQVDGDSVDGLSGFLVEEGETLNIRVMLESVGNVEDVRVRAEISGYEFDDGALEERSEMFNIHGTNAGPTEKPVWLELDLPNRLEKDRYLLRLRVTDKDNADMVRYAVLQIEPTRRGVDIADVSFSPGNTVKAGRSLLTTVLLENFGDKDEKDVKVTVSMPALGVSATEYVDTVYTDNHNVDYEDVPEMFLQIPASAAEGEYLVEVTVTSDKLDTVTETHTVNVLPNELFGAVSQERLVLAVGPETQTIAAGKTARYAVALTNAGVGSKAYLLSATAGDWASVSLSDNLVVLESGKNQVVYVDVTAASDAVPGAQGVSVTIASDDEVLETVTLSATVAEGQADMSLRNGLEIALIVLVVILVIIGLIIGFSRLRRDEDEQEEKAYY